MAAGLASSAAREIQLTADCELPLHSAARGRSGGRLEEAADGLASDAEADDLAGGVDVGNRVGRNQAAVAGEEARTNRECVGHVGERPVHRTLDLPDDPAPVVG